jgi:hypothetical protein
MPSRSLLLRQSLIRLLGLALGLVTLNSIRPAAAQSVSVQTPVFGVAIDADGVLAVKEYPDPGGRLFAQRVARSRSSLPENVFRKTDTRKISLVRLEREIAARLDAGRPLDDEMRHLAGLSRLQYVFLYPDEREIVIAGPAEGWAQDLSGRTVGVTARRPTLLLEDLIVALRAYAPDSVGRPFLGCTIQPTPEGLQKLAEFQKTIPRVIPQTSREAVTARIVRGVRDSMGMTKVHLFQLSDRTHFAQVLIEADYRMKRIGIGLEPPPVKMVTYISEVQSPRMTDLQRWWFTPHYECIRVAADGQAMELVGQGVELQGEDVQIEARPSPASTRKSPPARPSMPSSAT